MSGSTHGFGAREELLAQLAESEQDLWRRGGVHAQRRRREALRAALEAGCSLESIAGVLEVTPADVVAWLPRQRFVVRASARPTR